MIYLHRVSYPSFRPSFARAEKWVKSDHYSSRPGSTLKSRTTLRRPARVDRSEPPPPEIERDGEMPEGFDPSSSTTISGEVNSLSTSSPSNGELNLRNVQLDLGGSKSVVNKRGKQVVHNKGSSGARDKGSKGAILGGGFEEYRDGDMDELAPEPGQEHGMTTPNTATSSTVDATISSINPPSPAPPAAMDGEGLVVTKVVRKKRKKKREGEKDSKNEG